MRKQADKIQREKEKVWDILKRQPGEASYKGSEEFVAGYYYCPYVPILHSVSDGFEPIQKYYYSTGETTA